MDGNLTTLADLIVGNHVFDIPDYQRGYSRDTRHPQYLW